IDVAVLRVECLHAADSCVAYHLQRQEASPAVRDVDVVLRGGEGLRARRVYGKAGAAVGNVDAAACYRHAGGADPALNGDRAGVVDVDRRTGRRDGTGVAERAAGTVDAAPRAGGVERAAVDYVTCTAVEEDPAVHLGQRRRLDEAAVVDHGTKQRVGTACRQEDRSARRDSASRVQSE